MRIGLPSGLSWNSTRIEAHRRRYCSGVQANLPGGVGGIAGPLDMHHPLVAGQRDRRCLGGEVAPGRRLQIDPALAGAEGDPCGIGRDVGRVGPGQQRPPSSPCELAGRKVGMDAVIGDVDGDAVVRLIPFGVERNQARRSAPRKQVQPGIARIARAMRTGRDLRRRRRGIVT